LIPGDEFGIPVLLSLGQKSIAGHLLYVLAEK
jgi:hypothetical protein